ncbi:MAG: hypothetical protein FWH52_03225 [Synergistaceae bacterium]|nr:hypothetical protein [Synergistaceae bacterium]
MATNSENKGKIIVNLKDLRAIIATAEDLLKEIENRERITAKVRASANESATMYKHNYVKIDAASLTKACEELETETRRGVTELRTMINGLGKTIEGYIEIEDLFS